MGQHLQSGRLPCDAGRYREDHDRALARPNKLGGKRLLFRRAAGQIPEAANREANRPSSELERAPKSTGEDPVKGVL